MGPPFSAILGFCLLTAVATLDLMSHRVCVCVCVQCLYFLSILLMAISQVDRTITHSHLSFSLYINLCLFVCVYYPSTHSLSFNFFILPLLSLLLSPFLSLLSHPFIPSHSPCLPPFLRSGEREVREEEEGYQPHCLEPVVTLYLNGDRQREEGLVVT